MSDYNKAKWGPLDVKYLVIDTSEYIVFIDTSNSLDWITSDEYEAKAHPELTSHHSVLSQVALLECKPSAHFPEKFTIDFKRLLGEALARSLAGNCESANAILVNAGTYLQNRGEEISREWYLTSSGKLTSIVLSIGVLAWIFRSFVIPIIGQSAFYLGLAIVAGALGALLSIIMRMGSEKLDCHVGKNIHELESRYRIIAGMLSAAFIYLAISSEIVLPILAKSTAGSTGSLLIGFLSGLTERLAPSISSKIIDDKGKGSNSTDTD